MISKFRIYDELITEMLRNDKGTSEIAKTVLNTTESRHINKEVDYLMTYIKRNKKRLLDQHNGIYNASNEVDVANSTVKHLWLKTKKASVFIKNPNYIEPEQEPENEIDFTSIFRNKIQPIELFHKKSFNSEFIFDRLVYTDTHTGMDVNKNGFALYGGKWDKEEMFNRNKIMCNFVVQNQKSSKLLIHDLGDFMDGWNALTTRGGHELPQNMDNQEAFDTGLKFKIQMIDFLVKYYNEIEIINICNDNHSGAFGYVVNSAFKSFIELKYPKNVKVINQRKFIDHYFKENYCFILTHGKDDKSLKFGFKPILDAQQVEKIRNYISENKIYNSKIEFSKGDSQQYIFDNSTSKYFKYQNFPAFSPPSEWVQTNFQNSISGFVFFNYTKERSILIDYIF